MPKKKKFARTAWFLTVLKVLWLIFLSDRKFLERV